VQSEVWKKHPTYGRYEASSLGRIRNSSTGRILKPSLNQSGYFQTQFYDKKVRVHRVVAESFYGLSDLHVNHKNLNRQDNRVENLEFCTHGENIRHAVKNGVQLGARGERHGSNKYSLKQILEVKSLLAKNISHTEISRQTGVGRSTVYLVSKEKNWN
jgi:hypothetical protein